MYDKRAYIIRQQANYIRKLESQLHQLRSQRKQEIVVSVDRMFIPTYCHYVSHWFKDGRYKVKYTLTPCYLTIGDYDAYGWQLRIKYIQRSFMNLVKMEVFVYDL